MNSFLSIVLEGVAILLWGAIAVILLFVFAVYQSAEFGMAGATLTAGATYIFQAVQFEVVRDKRTVPILNALQILPVILFIASLALILLGV